MNGHFAIFDIWGDYAHFRKYYTTSSPLTFSIPPRTALIGFISAILGLDKDEYLKHMTKDKCHIGVRILAPIKKVRMGQNLINTKDGYWVPVARGFHEPRTQIRFEYLKNPKFRIYFRHTDEAVYKDLLTKLRDHQSVYTPYLGLSELLGNFSFVGEFKIKKTLSNTDFLDVHTVLPLDLVDKLEILQPGRIFFKERVPTEMLPGRVVTEYRDVIYEVEGKPIKAKLKNAIVLENDDVITTM
jgi:CRISPR-associated protein Cas5h